MWLFLLSHSFIFFGSIFINVYMVVCLVGLFNLVNYVFLLICLSIVIAILKYYYCYVRSVLCILFHCVVLCIVCG
jgi:hypothetical protein